MNRFVIKKVTKEVYFVEKSLRAGYVRLVSLNQYPFPIREVALPLYYDSCPNTLILRCIFTWDKKYWEKYIFKELS